MFSHRNHMSYHTQDISQFCWAAFQMFLLCTFLEAFTLCDANENTVGWKELPGVFIIPSTTGHIGELFADGHTLCSLLMKIPQATFGEAHYTGRRLYWKLKQQRLLKSASGTIKQSWQLVIHGAFTTHALPLSLYIFFCLLHFYFSELQTAIFSVCLYNSLEESNEFHEDFYK